MMTQIYVSPILAKIRVRVNQNDKICFLLFPSHNISSDSLTKSDNDISEGHSLTTPGQIREDLWWIKKDPSIKQEFDVDELKDQSQKQFLRLYKRECSMETDASFNEEKANMPLAFNSQFDLSTVFLVII